MKDDLKNLMEEALDNIRSDRKSAQEFLNEIANQIASDPQQNKYLSPVAAKHVETMQRSNEQLVKIISIQKKSHDTAVELSEDDKDQIFNLIQGEVSNVK
jgi:hypothetical protein